MEGEREEERVGVMVTEDAEDKAERSREDGKGIFNKTA